MDDGAADALRDNRLPSLNDAERVTVSARRGDVGAGVYVFKERLTSNGVNSVLSGITCLQKAATCRQIYLAK